jgi:hypothetical protein
VWEGGMGFWDCGRAWGLFLAPAFVFAPAAEKFLKLLLL